MASVDPPLPAVLPPADNRKTLPKELLTLNPDMRSIAKSLRTITHLNIDPSKAADLLSCCYRCPENISNKIRDKHFCYSADACASRGSSRAMHRYIEPLWRGLNKSKTDEVFRLEFTKNCKVCGDEGFYKLWRGGKCFCSRECSNVSAATKRRCQKMMLDGQMPPDYVQIQNLQRDSLQPNAEAEDALYENISSSEDEEEQFLADRIYAQLSQASPVAIPTQLDISENDDSADVAAVKLHVPNVNAVEPEFEARTNSECTVGTMERASQSVSSVSSVSANPAAMISVKLEPGEITTAIPSSSSTNTAHFRLKRPCRTDHVIQQRPHRSLVSPPAGNIEASSIAAGTIRPPTDAPASVSSFKAISSIMDTVIKRELQVLHADASELAQPTDSEQQRYTQSQFKRSTNISDDDLEDGFEPLRQLNKRTLTARTPTASEQPQIVNVSDVSSRRSSVSYDRNIMPVTDNFEADLWQMGTGLSMIPDMETDPSLKKWQTEL